MKRLMFFILLVLTSVVASAKTYYVSTSGSDANPGTSSTAPWKTLNKVNSFVFAANDSILFKRGDVFFGSVVVNRNNLTFSAYGTGAKPVINGFVTASSWTSLGNGVYECAVNAKKRLNMVMLNGKVQQIGRYPNASDADGGYLFFEGATSTSITDNQLSSTVNWTGAEVAIRKNGFTIDRCIVTSQSGGTINYKMGRGINSGITPVMNAAKLDHGYFFMNDPRTLDQLGEWYFDSAKNKLQMFFGSNDPANFNVQVSAVDTLFNLAFKSSIKIDNLGFNGGNSSGIFAMNNSNVTVQYCDITNVGARGIHFFNVANVLIDNVSTNNVLSNGIQVISKVQPNVVVRNCTVKNTALLPGLGSYYESADYKGMFLEAANNLTVEYNVVDSTGLAGIQFQGNDVLVKNNKVTNFCCTLHDNGGIYSYVAGTDAKPGAYFTNRTVMGNIVINGVGAPYGTPSMLPYVAGIYLDGRTMNVTVTDNTISKCPKNGVHCNNPSGITIRNNTFFDNGRDISFMRWSWGSITNLNIKKNISFPLTQDQKNIYYTNGGLNTPVTTSLQDNLKSLGSIDSNYYHSISDAGVALEIYNTEGGAAIPVTPYSLDSWQQFTGHDITTKKPAQKIQAYTINSQVGSNLFPNSQFTSNINNTTVYGSGVTAAWDNTSKVTGSGSLRMQFATPTANRYGLLYNSVGAVSSAKKYVLRYTTVGTSSNGITRAYISKLASPYTQLVPTQSSSFGLTKKTHEFLFDAPISEGNARFMIEIAQTSGTTYIDNIEFYEVTATVNTIESQVKFIYNDTKAPKTYTLDAKYVGVDSTIYNGSLTLQPFSSKVMIKGGALDTLPVAYAGKDLVVKLPADTIVLTGTGTGTIISYSWTKIAGPSQYSLLNATTASAKVTNLVAGTYTFLFKVINKSGIAATDTVNVITSGVLPVNLVDFTAKASGNKVQLNWITSNEVNSSHYDVERSANGRDFEKIGTVISNNSIDQSSYAFTDNFSISSTIYYRLAMVDNDGSFSYSKIIAVSVKTGKAFTVQAVSVSSSNVKINITSTQQQPFSYAVTDVSGRILINKNVELQPGYNTLISSLPLSGNGIYYVKLLSSNAVITKAVVRQ